MDREFKPRHSLLILNTRKNRARPVLVVKTIQKHLVDF
jgi:hypothetical protein